MGFRIFSRDVGGKLLGLVLALTGSALWAETAAACHATLPADRVVHPTPECDGGAVWYEPAGSDVPGERCSITRGCLYGVGENRVVDWWQLVSCPSDGGNQKPVGCSEQATAPPGSMTLVAAAACRANAELNRTNYPDGVPIRNNLTSAMCPPSSRDRNPTLNIPVRPNNPGGSGGSGGTGAGESAATGIPNRAGQPDGNPICFPISECGANPRPDPADPDGCAFNFSLRSLGAGRGMACLADDPTRRPADEAACIAGCNLTAVMARGFFQREQAALYVSLSAAAQLYYNVATSPQLPQANAPISQIIAALLPLTCGSSPCSVARTNFLNAYHNHAVYGRNVNNVCEAQCVRAFMLTGTPPVSLTMTPPPDDDDDGMIATLSIRINNAPCNPPRALNATVVGISRKFSNVFCRELTGGGSIDPRSTLGNNLSLLGQSPEFFFNTFDMDVDVAMLNALQNENLVAIVKEISVAFSPFLSVRAECPRGALGVLPSANVFGATLVPATVNLVGFCDEMDKKGILIRALFTTIFMIAILAGLMGWGRM